MITALDPLALSSPNVTSYAFRKLDDNQGRRFGTQNDRIASYQMTESVGNPQYGQPCVPGMFGLKPRTTATRNLALEEALDGRRQKNYDFLPQDQQALLRQEQATNLSRLSETAVQQNAPTICNKDNQWLNPINSHVERYSRGSLVTDIQVARNDALHMPKPPMNFINANRPLYGIQSRENVKAALAMTQTNMQGMEKIQRNVQQIQANGLVWK